MVTKTKKAAADLDVVTKPKHVGNVFHQRLRARR